MGASIYYRSPSTVSGEKRSAIEAFAADAAAGRTWLSCEPAGFYASDDGFLEGGSKPSFFPDAEDAAAAPESGLPDGTVHDLLEILCKISVDHGIDREIVFEEEPPVGYIRNGRCDPEVISGAAELMEAIRMLGDMVISP